MVCCSSLNIVQLAYFEQSFTDFLKQSVSYQLVVAMFSGYNLFANGCGLKLELANEWVVQEWLPFF